MDKLKNVKCFLLDLDGTIYIGGKLIEGAAEFLKKVKEKGLQYCFLTNNSSLSTEDYINKLQNKGIFASGNEVLTSGYATAEYLKKEHKNKSVYLMGTKSLYNEFEKEKINLTEDNADIVVLAYDTELTYQKLCTACKYIRKGAYYIATHPDINCPAEEFPLPDTGSFIALIEKSTGRLPDIIIGKPQKTLAKTAEKRFGVKKSEIAMVGDRLYTDILFAQNNGFVSVLTLSGETDRAMMLESGIEPDVIINSVKDLTGVL